MAFYEAECKKKDELIGALKGELALYQKNLREKDYKLVDITQCLPIIQACMNTWHCSQVYVLLVDGRYVELEEMLSLKDKEILEKTRRLEELNTQVNN